MIRALLLAYYFPPVGGAGAQRSLKLARYLPELGCAVTVLSGPGELVDRWSPLDESLLRELGGGTEIHRVQGPEPGSEGRWHDRAERWLGVESAWSRWLIDGQVERGLAIGPDADVIIASMSPYVSAEAASILSRTLDVPWVADLRDPWALDEMTTYATALHRRRELRAMRQQLATAAAIVTTTSEAARRIEQRFPELQDRPVVSIPNGYDADDFAGPVPTRDDHAFRIVHTGYLHTDAGRQQRSAGPIRRVLGGGVRGTDILTRSHVFLLEAIDRVIARNARLASTIELHLAGVLSSSDREEAGRSGVVRTLGYLSHAEAIGLMRSADLLFLPMQTVSDGGRSAIVPGKTYEYLAAERPILAAIPPGDARDILAEAGTAHICAPDDVTAMAQALELQLERWREGAVGVETPESLLHRFERRTLAADYVRVIDSVVGLRDTSLFGGGRTTAPLDHLDRRPGR